MSASKASELRFHSTIATGRTIHIGHRDQEFSASFVKSEFDSCDLILQGSGDRSLIMIDSKFRNCIIEGRKAYGYFLHSASFTGCRFSGRFSDCVLGCGPQGDVQHIRDCDFSHATLNVVDFRGGLNYESCSWPEWPTVVFRITKDSSPRLRKLHLPPDLSGLISTSRPRDEDYLAIDLSQVKLDTAEVLAIIYSCTDALVANKESLAPPSQLEVERALAKFGEQHRKRELYSWWQRSAQQVSITRLRVLSDCIEIALNRGDTSTLQAPVDFLVRLSGGASCELVTKDSAANVAEFDRRFRVMGASNSEDYQSINLKGHRKELGSLRLRYDSIEYLDVTGRAILRPESSGARAEA